MTVGEKIRAMRKEREITQKELGVKCGIAESTIRRYELGKLNPKYETRKKIAQGLGVPLVKLLPDDVGSCEPHESNLGQRFHANIMKRFLDIK